MSDYPRTDVSKIVKQLAEERELYRMQMAAISSACLMNTRHSDPPLFKDHPYWTPVYQDAIEVVEREMNWRERAEDAEADALELWKALDEVWVATGYLCVVSNAIIEKHRDKYGRKI